MSQERMMIRRQRCPRCDRTFYLLLGHMLPPCPDCRERPEPDGMWEEHVVDTTPKIDRENIV